ncbi:MULTISPECIES: hypothetical protein [unclassified Nocardia]|uniref:hypothetical protein n=1 Tax=unclassified Nocardia TaxID=2637762 RepID=UPI00278C0395|nr:MULTISPECIES: hypothetical protein [unclassified Nocardia]
MTVVAGACADQGLWALIVLGFVVFDLFGGVTVNAMDAAKRWWHRPGQTTGDHLVFVAVHVHPFLMAWAVTGFGWWIALARHAAALVIAVIILMTSPRAAHRSRPGVAAWTAGITCIGVGVVRGTR